MSAFVRRSPFALFLLFVAVLFADTHSAFAQIYNGYTRSLTTIPQKGPYYSLATDAAGTTYVYDSNLGSPAIFTADVTGSLHTYLSAADGMVLGPIPSQITIDTAGTLYIPDPTNNRVLKSTAQGTFSVLPVNSGAFVTPTSVVTTPDGTVWVLQLNGGLAKYANGVVTQVPFTDPDGAAGTTGALYSGMAFGPTQTNTGNLYILNSGPISEVLSYNVVTGATAKVVDKNTVFGGASIAGQNVPVGFTAYSTSIASSARSGDVFIADDAGQVLLEIPYRTNATVFTKLPVTVKALTVSAQSTVTYIDNGNTLSEQGGNAINFGPNTGSVATLSYSTAAGQSQNYFVTIAGVQQSSDQSDYKITRNTCAPNTTAICSVDITSTPKLAGARRGISSTLNGSQALASNGTRSQLGALGAARLTFGNAARPFVELNGAPSASILTNATGAIAVDGAGFIYIGTGNNNSSRLVRLQPVNGEYYFAIYGGFIGTTTHPKQLALRGLNQIYYTDTSSGVYQGMSLVAGAEPSSLAGFALDASGDVIYASSANHRLTRVPQNSTDIYETPFYSDPSLEPEGLHVDGSNATWVFDFNTKKFVRIAVNGNVTKVGPVAGFDVIAYVVLPNGTIVYADSHDNTVHTYTAAGVDTIIDTGVNLRQMALLPDGSVASVDLITSTLVIYPFSSPVVNFTGTTVGKTTPDSPKTLTFTNLGNLASGTTTQQVTGAAGSASNTCAASVAVNGTCSVTASFKPTVVGTNTSTVTLTATGQVVPIAITLQGSGSLADHLKVTLPATATAGGFIFGTVTAQNADNTTTTAYTGTVHFTTSDNFTTPPPDLTFVAADNGTKQFNYQTLKAGTQTVTATDVAASAVTGTGSTVVSPGPASTIQGISGIGQTKTVGSAFDPLVVQFFDQYTNPVPGVTVTFTAGAGCTYSGSTTATATTAADGKATSPACTTTSTTGAFDITASTGGINGSYGETTAPFSGGATVPGITFLGAVHQVPGFTFTTPGTLVVDNKGVTYVYDAAGPTVYRVERDGTRSVYLNTADGLVMTSATAGLLTLDATGKLYIPDPAGNRVYVASAAHTLTNFTTGGAQAPTAVIVNGATTYVLQQTAGLATLSGGALTSLNIVDPNGAAGAKYTGMALNKQGRIFITNANSGELFSYNTATQAVAKIYDGATTINGLMGGMSATIAGITADNDGFIYTVDATNGRIIKSMPTVAISQQFTGVQNLVPLSLGVNPTNSIAYVNNTVKGLYNISDTLVDLGAKPGPNPQSSAVMYFNANVQVTNSVGTLGQDNLLNTGGFGTTSPTTCLGSPNPGYCTVGVLVYHSYPGSITGYSFTKPQGASAGITVPMTFFSATSELALLETPVRRYDNSDPQYYLHFQGNLYGSAGPIALDGIGNLYTGATNYSEAGNTYNAGLLIIGGNNTGNHSNSLASPITNMQPNLIAIDGPGNLYFTDSSNAIFATRTATFPAPAMVVPAGATVSGLATDARGLLFVTRTGAITRYDIAGGTSSVVHAPAGAKLQGVYIDANNAAVTFDANQKKFITINPNGSTASSPAVTTANVSSIAVTPSNAIFFTDADTATLHILMPDGTDKTIATGTTTAQLSLLRTGDLALVNTATQTLDVYAFATPIHTFANTTVGITTADSPKEFKLTNLGYTASSTATLSIPGGTGYTLQGDNCAAGLAINGTCSTFALAKPTQLGSNVGGIQYSFNTVTGTQPRFDLTFMTLGLAEAKFSVVTADPARAGVQQSVTIKALASDNTVYNSFNRTVHFTSNDPAATLPADHTFIPGDNGQYTAFVNFKTAGSRTLTVTETTPAQNGLPLATGSQTLTVNGGNPASIAVSSGNNQSTPIGTAFPAPFVAVVKDSFGNGTGGATVVFGTGGACTFTTGSSSASVTSDSSGLATSPICNANGTVTNFSVTAVVSGTAFTATFSESVTKGTPTVLFSFPQITYPQAANATVTVSGSAGFPGGSVAYSFDTPVTGGSSLTSLNNGAASIAIPTNLTSGQHTLYVSYPGDNNYNTAAGTGNFTVQAGTVTLSASNVTQTYNSTTNSTVMQSATGNAPTGKIYYAFDATPTTGSTFVNVTGASETIAVPATLASGNHTLNILYSGDTYYGQAAASATVIVNQFVSVITWTNPAAITYGTLLSATQLNATVNAPGTLVYTPDIGARPSAGTQTLSVVFTPTDATNYTTANRSVQIVVNKATATVNLSNLAQTYTGSPLAASVTTNPAGVATTVTYSGSATAPTAPGNYTVVASLNDVNYNPASANGTLVISQQASTTVLTASPTTAGQGQPVVFTATVAGVNNGAPAGSVSFSQGGTVVATVAVSNGKATYTTSSLPLGMQSFTASSTGDTNYTGAPSNTVTVNVLQPTTITWSNPAAITYGAALSPAQLNATANVPGTFAYTPAAGTTLNAGTQTLSVTFTPNDSVNYAPSTATVQIVVNKATATLALGGLAQTYTGIALPVSVTTTPSGLQTIAITYNGSAAVPVNAGSYAVVASLTNANYNAANATGTLVIAQQASTTTLTSNTASGATTFTARVAGSASGTPGGTVTFNQGTTVLATVPVTNGVATYTTSSLPSGTVSITATSSGDANYAGATSTAVTVTNGIPAADFTITTSGAQSATVLPGATATFTFNLAPTTGTYPAPVTFSVSGLPTGATATFSNPTIAAGAGAQSTVLTVQTPLRASLEQKPLTPGSRTALYGTLVCLLLLPMAAFKSAKLVRRNAKLLIFFGAALLGAGALTGCGTGTGNGFLVQQQQTYNLVVTATSGTVSHVSNVTLTVQ